MKCVFHLSMALDVTFALLSPAPAKPGVAMRPSAGGCVCGKCDCATTWSGFISTCITEHCQKQDIELHVPSLNDYLVLMVVVVIYYRDALGRLHSKLPCKDSLVRQRWCFLSCICENNNVFLDGNELPSGGAFFSSFLVAKTRYFVRWT